MEPIRLRPNKGNPLFALGKVTNLPNLPTYLERLSNAKVNFEELYQNIEQNFNKNKVLYFERIADKYTLVDQQTESTCSFAVYTGYTTPEGEPLYAKYDSRSDGWTGVRITTKSSILNSISFYEIGSLRFRTFEDANAFIINLHDILMPGEIWDYEGPISQDGYEKTRYSILQSYLKIVTSVLVADWDDCKSLNYNKIAFSAPQDGQHIYALINTGLLSDKASDIYIYGSIGLNTPPSSGRFWINNPVILKKGMKELDRLGFYHEAFQQAQMVSFFREINDILFDTSRYVDINAYDALKHCIEDGIKRNRFPEEFKSEWEKGHKQYVVSTFKAAIINSLKLAKRNYKYVVPQYSLPKPSEKKGKLQFLMPIYMKANYSQLPDFALILDKLTFSSNENDFYYAPKTILELPLAYNNARAICKPDNTWLDPEKFKKEQSNHNTIGI